MVELLREHPAFGKHTFDDGSQIPSVYMAVPNGYSEMSVSELATCLLKTTVASSGAATADLLLRYLSIGDTKTIPAFEVTILGGLSAQTELEVFPGLDILPHDRAVERGFSTRVTERDVFHGTPNLQMMQPLCIVCSARLGPGWFHPTPSARRESGWQPSSSTGRPQPTQHHPRSTTVNHHSGMDVLGTSFAVPEFRGLNPSSLQATPNPPAYTINCGPRTN